MFDKHQNEEPRIGWGSEAELKQQLEAMWPKDEAGEAEKAVFLSTIPDFNNEADFAINMLMAYGIPAFKSYNNEGSLGKLIIGTSAYGASIYVPASMVEDAKALLESPAELSDEDVQSAEAATEEA